MLKARLPGAMHPARGSNRTLKQLDKHLELPCANYGRGSTRSQEIASFLNAFFANIPASCMMKRARRKSGKISRGEIRLYGAKHRRMCVCACAPANRNGMISVRVPRKSATYIENPDSSGSNFGSYIAIWRIGRQGKEAASGGREGNF